MLRILADRGGGYMDNMRDWGHDSGSSEKSYVLLAFALILAVAGAIGLGYYLTRPEIKYAVSANVISRLDPPTRKIAIRLNEEPCNRTLATQFANSLSSASEYAATISFVRYTEKKCGLNEDLLTPLSLAQKNSGDFDGAEKSITRIIDLYPNAARAYFERGEVRAAHGDYSGSYEDFRKAIYVYSDPSTILYRGFDALAKDAVKLGRPCEAVATIRDYIAFDSLERRSPQLLGLIAAWQKQGACPSASGNGIARLKYTRTANAIILPVKVNGVEGRMIIDTGASRTVFTKTFAARAGIEPMEDDGAMVRTANGSIWVMGGRAKKVSLGSASTGNVPVFIQTEGQKGFGQHIDGLLGLSFLGNFKFTLNNGVLELQPLT